MTHQLAKRIKTTPHYTTGHVELRRFSYQYLNAYEDLPGITIAAQLGHRKAGTDETTGDEAKFPKTRSPEAYAFQNARRHPRGSVRCQIAPEQ